jgi:malonyl-CoA/methylmalonyl-CoA synthetase
MAMRRGVMSARLWRAPVPGQVVDGAVGPDGPDGPVTTEPTAVPGFDPDAGRTLLGVWSARWAADPQRPVLVDGNDRSTALGADALQESTAGAAAALSGWGVQPGDRVLWSCSSSLASIVALLGALRLGAIVVPVNPSATRSELAYVLGDVGPSAAVVDRPAWRQWVEAARPGTMVHAPQDLLAGHHAQIEVVLDAAGPDDDALIVYTSGTTGEPKGAVHTHRSLLAGAASLCVAWAWRPEDRLILTLPLFHVHGLCAGLFGTLAAGASALVFDRFTPDAVLGAVPHATMFFGVPTMYHRLAESGHADELAALRLCVAGSAPLPADLWRRYADRWGVSVLERYGMSETLLTLSNPLEGERRPGAVGLPLPGVEATVAAPDVDGIGELMVRGPSLCRGYWNRPEASSAMWVDGWFATGDLASVSDDGYFSIRGRRTELIITGGHNVYPAEVEAVLGRHPSVAEVAVAGLPSAEWGESVTAFVVGAAGPPDVAALAALATEELSSYKRPREFRVLDSLPRNALGKVVRRELR